MANGLEEYVQNQLVEHKAEFSEIERLIEETLNVFAKSYVEGSRTWPYELIDDRPVPESCDFSFSTAAMISFAIRLATGQLAGSPLAPAVRRGTVWRSQDRELEDRLRGCVEGALQQTAVRSQEIRNEVTKWIADGWRKPRYKTPVTTSSTFGWDDPFTLAWLAEVVRSAAGKAHDPLRRRVLARAKQVVEHNLGIGEPFRGVLELKGGEEVPHAFSLLRTLQLAQMLEQAGQPATANLAPVRRYLLARVHERLSESEIPHSGFDVGDLVFALEGWLIASGKQFDEAVVSRAFEVIGKQQELTPYWRPVRPFKATAQGLVLLPQSVEIANALLRICTHGRLKERNQFSSHLSLFKTYTRWLLGRLFRGTIKDRGDMVGWESEHTYTLDRIHLWQTSQALIYLQHYSALLRDHVGARLLRVASLVVREPDADERDGDLAAWFASEPFRGGSPDSSYHVYERVKRAFIDPRLGNGDDPAFSMLLYGPPGTGKSMLAEKVALAIGAQILTVTPGDFLAAGGEHVEARAKAILRDVLPEQRNLLVLFDEIDQLLLDRDSNVYRNQGDVFKLLTPGMLTKLNDLSKDRVVVFAVATNYWERIDKAIKRAGRFDATYLLLPPDLEQRKNWLARQRIPDLNARDRAEIARQTVRFTYAELEQLVRGIRRDEASGSSVRESFERQIRELSPVALTSYFPRIFEGDQRRDAVDRPLEEFALLAYLQLEVDGSLPDEPIEIKRAVRLALENERVDDRVVREALDSAVRRKTDAG